MSDIPITAYKCKKCGKIHYPFHDRCLKCKAREFESIHPAGRAKLLTFTQIFNLPWGFDERFLIIGIGEFENGVKAMGQIKAEDIAGLKLGMKMTPTWAPVRKVQGESVHGLVFELA
ncbi:MAG: hypothetical protein A2Z37_00055 [Chloroflexi bacterium RBG_19FT_COMBO_62_14]|nr:MAG: hypothetical protein A2Z37_00055 [Chloroflexi bacterium RBG_19FT_COMBO_62_14]